MTLDDLLLEISYQLPKGYPTIVNGKFVDREEVLLINKFLLEHGIGQLPLPETIDIPTTLNEVSETDVKEWTVCLIADMCNLYGSAMVKALTNYKTSLKDPSQVLAAANVKNTKQLASALVDSSYNYYLSSQTEIDRQLNILGFGTSKVDKKVAINSISSGIAINKRYGKVYLVRDEENFNSVKKHAVKLWSQEFQKEQLFPDNWCPADIFVSTSDPTSIAENAKKATSINTVIGTNLPLNKYFADPTSKVPSGLFVGISLKQETAQGGKGTNFIDNVLLDAKTSDFSSSSTIDKNATNKIINYKGFSRYAETPNKKDKAQPAVKLIEKGLPILGIKLNTKDGMAMYTKMGLDKVASTLKQIGTIGDLHDLKTLPKNVQSYKTLVDKEAARVAKSVGSTKDKIRMFVESRDAFIKTLKSSNVQIKSVTKSEDLVLTMKKELGNKFDIYMVQKIATYNFYVDIFNNWAAKTKSLKPYFKKISKVSNPFVALAMFCIGEAGITPSFTKLKADHWDDFTHDYTIDVNKTAQDVKVTDNPGAGGFDSNFKLYFGKTKSYDVTLSFRFSNTAIRVEVVNITGLG